MSNQNQRRSRYSSEFQHSPFFMFICRYEEDAKISSNWNCDLPLLSFSQKESSLYSFQLWNKLWSIGFYCLFPLCSHSIMNRRLSVSREFGVIFRQSDDFILDSDHQSFNLISWNDASVSLTNISIYYLVLNFANSQS